MPEKTDTQPLRAELERQAAAPAEKTVFDLIDRMQPEIMKVLGSEAMAERFARVIATEARRNVKLQECDPMSFLGAMLLSAQLGLEPGPLGLVYLVPFKRQVEFIVGYRGYVELAYRSGLVKDLTAALVHDGDSFSFQYGTTPKLTHVPEGPTLEREIVAAYAVARLKSGGTVFVVTYEEDWEKARKASAAGSKNLGPWVEHREAMIRKTAVRRLEPMLPKSAAFARAFERDENEAPQPEEVADAEIVL
jgi:recombination protein RecT